MKRADKNSRYSAPLAALYRLFVCADPPVARLFSTHAIPKVTTCANGTASQTPVSGGDRIVPTKHFCGFLALSYPLAPI